MTLPPFCRVCLSTELDPLPFEVPADAGDWARCRACGSDTAAHAYADVAWAYHDRPHYDSQFGHTTVEALREDCRSNCDWFDHHHRPRLPRTFLDVGTWHGAALDVMQALGWSVHGFDVAEPPFMGPHVTVRPHFHRHWWHYRFAAVMAREVVEHVESPDLFLHELHGVAEPLGLVQVQTPRPLDRYHGIPYQRPHLFVASPAGLKALLARNRLDVLDERHWEVGQAYLARALG